MSPNELPTDLIRIGKAAKLVDGHVNMIRRWIYTGKIKGYRSGCRGHFRVSRQAVIDLMQPVKLKPEKQEEKKEKAKEQAYRKWANKEAKRLGLG